MNEELYGAAVHEAGHAVVAWALGVSTRKMVVGVGGDDSAGKADIDLANHLPIPDQIAICSAGLDAQRMLGARTNEHAGFMDMVLIGELIEDRDDGEAEALRREGFDRSVGLLELHREVVERLALALARDRELLQEAIEQIVGKNRSHV